MTTFAEQSLVCVECGPPRTSFQRPLFTMRWLRRSQYHDVVNLDDAAKPSQYVTYSSGSSQGVTTVHSKSLATGLGTLDTTFLGAFWGFRVLNIDSLSSRVVLRLV